MFSKKMITLLILMIVMVAGTATAGEHAADWKLYGKLHTSLNLRNNSDNMQIDLSSNTSRFGVKGSTELNDTFTLIWQWENSLNMVDGAGTLTNRNTFLGLKGDWGMALFGRHDTPYKILGRKVTNFKDTIGDFRNTTMGWDRRLPDVIAYGTPDLDGFGALFAFLTDQHAFGAPEAANAFSGMLTYDQGELFVGVAYEMLTKGFATATWTEMTVMGPITHTVYGDAPAGFRAVAKYDFGELAVSGLFQSLTNANELMVDNTGTVTTANDHKAMTIGGEVIYKIDSKWGAKASFYMANPNTDAKDLAAFDDDNDPATPDVNPDESAVEYSQLAIGIDHYAAKTVMFYLQFCMVMNGDNAMQGIGQGNGFGGGFDVSAMGESPLGVSFGMVKTF